MYHRLYLNARRQLEALRRLDFGTLENLTREREKLTEDICRVVRQSEDEGYKLPPPAKRRIKELTARILDVDSEIKEMLLEELKERTLELSGLTRHKRD